jgi:hypothetical protein
MAPCVWNTLNDVDGTFAVIGEVVQSREYLSAGQVAGGGPAT